MNMATAGPSTSARSPTGPRSAAWSGGYAVTPVSTLRDDLPRGVEAIRRGEHLFLISHADQPVEVDIGARCLDRLSSAVVGPRAVLAPRDVLVLGPGPADRGGAIPEVPGQLSQR